MPAAMTAVDLGCGSGRHLKLLSEIGISRIIGLDASHGALLISRKTGQSLLVRGNNRQLPLKDGSADIIIAWGSLHYNVKSDLAPMLDEILRILKQDGQLFATLRSSRDTYLKRGTHLGNDMWVTDLKDISGSTASFYTESEIRKELSTFQSILVRSDRTDAGRRYYQPDFPLDYRTPGNDPLPDRARNRKHDARQ